MRGEGRETKSIGWGERGGPIQYCLIERNLKENRKDMVKLEGR